MEIRWDLWFVGVVWRVVGLRWVLDDLFKGRKELDAFYVNGYGNIGVDWDWYKKVDEG